jgi:hypothetical protein
MIQAPCLSVCPVRLSVANAHGSELKPVRLSTDIPWSVLPWEGDSHFKTAGHVYSNIRIHVRVRKVTSTPIATAIMNLSLSDSLESIRCQCYKT